MSTADTGLPHVPFTSRLLMVSVDRANLAPFRAAVRVTPAPQCQADRSAAGFSPCLPPSKIESHNDAIHVSQFALTERSTAESRANLLSALRDNGAFGAVGFLSRRAAVTPSLYQRVLPASLGFRTE